MENPGRQVLSSFGQTFEKFIPDLLFLLLMIFCSRPLMEWQLQHLSLSCTLLMALNTAAVSMGAYRFFAGYADEGGLLKYVGMLRSFERSLLGLSVFISCFAFFWWLVPFSVAKELGVKETGFIIGMSIYFISFLAIVAGTISNRKALQVQQSSIFRTASAFVTGAFFFFSTCLLLALLPSWQPGFIGAKAIAIICMIVFYLPIRIFLLLRPPFHRFEYPLFLLSFIYLMLQIFMQ